MVCQAPASVRPHSHLLPPHLSGLAAPIVAALVTLVLRRDEQSGYEDEEVRANADAGTTLHR